jgi:hypothetical protein
LLNTDYKIAAKAVTTRLAGVLPSVIDATQTAFVPGRWIGDNILCHLDIFDYVDAPDSACILFLDFEKAYDKVCRDWLFACLERLGVGPHARRWIRLLLAGTHASVSFAGVPSRSFAIRSGAAQGSPLSPLLYVVAAQPLAAALRRLQAEGSIDALRLPAGEKAPASHQHADDTTIHTASIAGAETAIARAVQPFCKASGAVLNLHKSKGVVLGAHPDITGVHPTTGITFINASETVRHLGVLLTKGDKKAAAAASWQKLITRVAMRVRHWRTIHLTLFGRAYVAKQLMASVITHIATFIPPPDIQLKALQSLIDGYILSTSGGGPLTDDRPLRGKPPAYITALPKAEGGLGAPDIAIQGNRYRSPSFLLVFSRSSSVPSRPRPGRGRAGRGCYRVSTTYLSLISWAACSRTAMLRGAWQHGAVFAARALPAPWIALSSPPTTFMLVCIAFCAPLWPHLLFTAWAAPGL